MKNALIKLFVYSLTLTAGLLSYGQGSLTPPGPPAPTMKTLDQVQPRIPITYVGFAVINPGSYYMTSNLVASGSGYGIYIVSDNVTIDLSGFTLQGSSGSFSGIYIFGNRTNITIRNGIITGWGGDGIGFNYPSASPQNIVAENLSVTANGHHGISIGGGGIIFNCSIQNNNWLGIDVFGDNCRVVHNSLTGNNTGNHSGMSGISVSGNNNLIEDNFVSGLTGNNGIGISTGTSNLVMKNSVIGWGTANDYVIPNFNNGGPVGTAANSTSPFANIAL